jgi:peptidoglycan-N-acetylglucosamine deacetylase
VGANKRLVTLKGLPNLITGLRGRGFEFVTVSQLVSEA